MLKVRQYPDPVLRMISKPILRFGKHLVRLSEQMKKITVYEHGAGLAACQIGIPIRMLTLYDLNENRFYTICNPEIVKTFGEDVNIEGCLSFKGQFRRVKRPLKVRVKYFDPTGKFIYNSFEGLLARALMHEINHLDGILLIDDQAIK